MTPEESQQLREAVNWACSVQGWMSAYYMKHLKTLVAAASRVEAENDRADAALSFVIGAGYEKQVMQLVEEHQRYERARRLIREVVAYLEPLREGAVAPDPSALIAKLRKAT